LGAESKQFWHDHNLAKVNSIRIQNAIKLCDLAVIRFGDKYNQWSAAYDATAKAWAISPE
jgi:YtoQ family protein